MKALFAALLLGAALAAPIEAAAQATAESKAAAKSAGEAWPRIVQDYEPTPALWVLRDDDTTIYLLGTFHVLPRGFRWRSPRLDEIVAQADELVVESREEDDGELAGSFAAELMASLEKRSPISERLSPTNARKWLALAKISGMPAEQFDRLPPLLAMFGLGLELVRYDTGSVREFGVETVLEAEFEAAGKPIGSIESAIDVLAALLAIDERLLIKDLERDLSLWDGKSLDTLFMETPTAGSETAAAPVPLAAEHAWAQGQRIVDDNLFGDTPMGRIMEKVLLEDRNRAWALWLEQRLASPGTVLVAVGAAHLEGDSAVQVMLVDRGLAATRLD